MRGSVFHFGSRLLILLVLSAVLPGSGTLLAGEGEAEGKTPAAPAAPAKPTGRETLAELGAIKIPLSLIWKVERAQLANARKRNPNLQPRPEQLVALRRQIAMTEIEMALLQQYTAEQHLAVSPEAFQKWFEKFKRQLAQQRVAYGDFLNSIAKNDKDFQAISRARLAVEKKLGAEVSGAEVDAAFQQRKDRLPLRRCSHILFMYKGSGGKATRGKEEAKKLAVETLSKIKAGADFGTLAQQVSEGPSGKQRKGDLDFVARRGQMVQPFADAVYALKKVGDVSDVVETRFGFHLIKLTGKRDPETQKKMLKDQLVFQKFKKFLQQFRIERMKNVKLNEKLLQVGPPPAQK